MPETRLPNFDTETIKTFFAVAKYKNFGDASEVLHITPAAASYRIRSLEQQLGCKLFKRTHLTLELLPAGVELNEIFLHLWHVLENIPNRLQQACDHTVHQLTICTDLSFSPKAMSKVIAELSESFPNTHLYSFSLSNSKSYLESPLKDNPQLLIGNQNSCPYPKHCIGFLCWYLVIEKEAMEKNLIQQIYVLNHDNVVDSLKQQLFLLWLKTQHCFISDYSQIEALTIKNTCAYLVPQTVANQLVERLSANNQKALTIPITETAIYLYHHPLIDRSLIEQVKGILYENYEMLGFNKSK